MRFIKSNKAGFTIIELMVAVAISLLAVAAVYSSFIIQQRSLTSQDQVAETQVASKISFDMVVDEVRNAGFGFPAAETVDINNFSSTVTDCDNCDGNGTDAITFTGGFRQLAELAEPAVTGLHTIRLSYTGSPKFNLTDSRFITFDGVGFAEIINCALESGDDDNAKCDEGVFALDRGINKPYPAGRPVYLVEDVTYCVVTDQNDDDFMDLRRIRRNADVAACSGTTTSETDALAEDINDLQFAYAVDNDDDGRIDDQNDNNIFDPGDYISPPLPVNSKVMAVRVNVLASTRAENPNIDPSTKPYYVTGITLENNTTSDQDSFVRRIWSMEASVRNPK
jgi:prepilin-type N-terminal cleavage/methylation domain-containing protein